MKSILKKFDAITVLLISFIVLFVINSLLIFRNSSIIVKNNDLKVETEAVKRAATAIISNVIHGADLGVRGYALTKNIKLAEPLELVSQDQDSIFDKLESLLVQQNYDLKRFHELKRSVYNYLQLSHKMVQLAKEDKMEEFIEILNEDRGFLVWQKYKAFYEPLFQYQDKLNSSAQKKYVDALFQIRIIQILLVLLGIPSIIYIILKLKSEMAERQTFLQALDESNRKYIFNDGSSHQLHNWKQVIDNSIKNFQYANEFVTKISMGSYSTEWAGMNASNEKFNQANLAGRLVNMSSYLIQTKINDEKRNWSSSGMAKFAELIRDHKDIRKLGDTLISNIVKYTDSNQGSLFLVNDENNEDVHLQLLSCYAWDKIKFLEKTVHLGEGLVGQCWYEGEPAFLTAVPSDYIHITSGLGYATPRNIFIAPLKVNGVIYGMLEVASFEIYEDHKRDFITKVSEIIASAIANIKVNNHTKYLLEQSQLQAEVLHKQEMEHVQNMHELLATQEEMKRFQIEIEAQTSIINSILIVSKTDLRGNITFVNDEFCKWSKYTREEIIGKNHRYLKSGHQPDEIFKDLWKTISSGKIWRGEIKNRAKDGSNYSVEAFIAPVMDSNGKPKEYLAQSFLLYEKKAKEEYFNEIPSYVR